MAASAVALAASFAPLACAADGQFALAEAAKTRGELRPLSAAALRGLLAPDALYVSFVVKGDAFMAIAISAHGGSVRGPVAVPGLAASIAAYRFLLAIPPEWRERIAKLPKVWRRADGAYQVAAAAPEPGAAAVEDADEPGGYLGEILLAPLARELAGSRRLIVSPDGGLAFVPFEALRLARRYVVESHEVHYTASAALYARSRERAAEYARLEGRSELLSVGGAAYGTFVRVSPVLDIHHELLAGMPPPRQAAAPRPTPSGMARAFKALKVAWANLPGTAAEAQRIAALFDSSRVLVGVEASERRLQELNATGELARFRHIFFATHGYLSPYDPGLSSVVLSLVGNKGAHDGYISAAEWPRYTLRSDLVVLSASNSGFGPVAGAQGLLGLPYALHLAGNRNAVFSLWTLNDAASAELIARFFGRVREGADHVTALAEAKRAAVSAGRRPSSWAQFVLHGS